MNKHRTARNIFQQRQDLRDLGIGGRRQPRHRYVNVRHAGTGDRLPFRFGAAVGLAQIQYGLDAELRQILKTLIARLSAAVYMFVYFVEILDSGYIAGENRQAKNADSEGETPEG